MKFSKKCRYGVTALIDLAMHSRDTHVSLGSIAERNQISPQYLEQVFASLRRARIVRSVKGSQGGYLLNYPADKITVSQIVEALEGVGDRQWGRNCFHCDRDDPERYCGPRQ